MGMAGVQIEICLFVKLQALILFLFIDLLLWK